MANISQRSFAAGEVAPEFYARTDLARYLIALRTCRNMMVKRAGGVMKRPGTQFVAPCKRAEVVPPEPPCVESLLEEETFDDYATQGEFNAVWAGATGEIVFDPPPGAFPPSPDNSNYWGILVSTPMDSPAPFGSNAGSRSHTFTGLTAGTTYRIRYKVNVASARHGEIGHFPAPHTMTFGAEATGGDRTIYTFNWLYSTGLDDANIPVDSTPIEVPNYPTEDVAYPGTIGTQRPSWAGWVDLSTLGVADISGEITVTIGVYDARNAFCEMGIDAVRLVSFCPDAAELPPSTIRRYLRIHTTETYQSPENGFGLAEVQARETPLGTDFAATAVLTASYSFFTFLPALAQDAFGGTFWMTGFQSTPLGNWLVMDFGVPRDITEITLQMNNVFPVHPKDMSIEVSDNGLEWDDIGWSYTDIPAWSLSEIRTFTRP